MNSLEIANQTLECDRGAKLNRMGLQQLPFVGWGLPNLVLTGVLGLTGLGLDWPQPKVLAVDPQGNYTTQDFFPGRDEYALSTWTVVATQLNCRQQPKLEAAIARTFHKGDALTVKTAEGSHENVGYLQLDNRGKPWVRVYQANPDQPTFNPAVFCFVRANRRYIAPVFGGS